MGNRKTEIQNGTTYEYCYHVSNCNAAPKGNRLINIRTGSATGPLYRQFDYDDSGRLLRKRNGAGTALYNVTYNGKGRAKAINGNSFAYDPNDYRIKRQNSLYLLEGEHLEATYTSAGVLQNKYLRGVVVDEIVNGYTYHSDNANDWTNYTFHHDHLNSVTALTGHAGSTKEANRYDAFGAILNLTLPGTGNEQLFTGRQLDVNTGLYYYRARYYDAEIGRFISEDPLGFGAGVNFYAYVGNNPVNFSDPMGKDAYTLGLTLQIPILGSKISAGVFVAGVPFDLPFIPQTTKENFDIGLFGQFFPGQVGDVITNITGAENKPEFSQGFSTIPPGAKSGLTIDGGVQFGGQSSLNGVLGEISVGLIDRGVTAGLNLNPGSNEFPFSGLEINVGPQLGASGNIGVGGTVSIGDVFQHVVFPAFDAAKDLISPGSKATSAGGGFVLYPSRPNTNQLQSVYSK